ncbi:MAG: flagellin [Bacillaceae bacterium]|nr:flagellin [Bacillaceae bacterium]
MFMFISFFLNGEEIDRAYDFNGHGYFHSGQSVSIIGDARPNITEATNGHQLQVLYSDPLSLSLDRSAIPGFSEEHCEHNIGQGHLLAEINHESLVVSLNGNVLSDDQYAFNGGQITLNSNKVNLSLGSHRLSASYEARHPLSYDPNEFIFQVGANSGDSLKLEIVSFDNMLLNTNAICVTMEPHAGRSLQMIDDALSFVTRQRSHMGATMNRMDAIASNLKTVQENTTASLSRIEDADMAKEMMDLVKQRLLTQVQVAISTQNQQSYHKS